jgi:phosphate transport system protein
MPIKLQTELTTLRRQILTMGAAAEQRVGKVIDALVDEDMEAARFVRTGDDEIDSMEIQIEEECLRVLALSQPVAGDLRFVLAVLRINADLERIADHAKSIAKRILDLEDVGRIKPPAVVIEMAICSKQMLGDALAALANQDGQLCRRIRRADKRVDDLQKEVFAWVHQEIPQNVDATQGAIDILSMARAFERIADMATNIAEDVIFVTEGSVVRHAKI